jgi:hypothetical protein
MSIPALMLAYFGSCLLAHNPALAANLQPAADNHDDHLSIETSRQARVLKANALATNQRHIPAC